MSQNKQYREAWVKAIFAQAVTLFHQARKLKVNARVPLSDLARQCANTLMQENAHTIVGDREICAKEFLAYCREHFAAEIQTAIGERARAEIANRPQEARVM